MVEKINIGALSVTGKSAAEAVSELLSGVALPVKVVLQNRLSFAVAYSGAPRLEAEGAANGEDQTELFVTEESVLTHIVRSAQGLSELYGFSPALTIRQAVVAETETVTEDSPEVEAATEDASEDETAADETETEPETTGVKKRGRKSKN